MRPATVPTVELVPANAEPVMVRVEIVDTPPARRRGLMHRRHMPRDAGMLFVFQDVARRTFWMRDTFIALDIIFISEDRTILGIVEDARPLSDDGRAIDAASKYVLEVHAGFAREHGIAIGDTVRLVGVAEE